MLFSGDFVRGEMFQKFVTRERVLWGQITQGDQEVTFELSGGLKSNTI